MSTESDAARGALRSWRRRRDAIASERDPLVIAALKSGLTKEEVHVLTGLGRTTIARIAVILSFMRSAALRSMNVLSPNFSISDPCFSMIAER